MRGCLWLRNLDALSQQYRNERAWEGSGCPKGLKRNIWVKETGDFTCVTLFQNKHGCYHFGAIANPISSIDMLSASAGGTATPKSQLTQLTYKMSRAQLTQLTQRAQLTHSICWPEQIIPSVYSGIATRCCHTNVESYIIIHQLCVKQKQPSGVQEQLAENPPVLVSGLRFGTVSFGMGTRFRWNTQYVTYLKIILLSYLPRLVRYGWRERFKYYRTVVWWTTVKHPLAPASRHSRRCPWPSSQFWTRCPPSLSQPLKNVEGWVNFEGFLGVSKWMTSKSTAFRNILLGSC